MEADNRPQMIAEVFVALLTMFMVCDDPDMLTPTEYDAVAAFLNEEAKRRGYADWIEAYHNIRRIKP